MRPMDKNEYLRAWQPWTECLSAFKYLSCLESPGEFQNWRIYWVGTLTLLKTIRDVLERVDKNQSKSHSKAIHDFLKEIATKKKLHPIYWDFICDERDNLVHEFSLSAKEHPVTSYTMLDRGLTYQQLVSKYGERKMIIWGEEGEDGLRLLEIALNWWEMHLRTVEQAVREKEPLPFSSGMKRREDLIEASFKYRGHFDYSWERGSITPTAT